MNSYELLQKFFLAKKRKNPSFSLRAVAKKMEVSASYFSEILSGKKRLPLSRVSQVAKTLGMDSVAQDQLTVLLQRELLKLAPGESSSKVLPRKAIQSFDPVPEEKDFSILEKWYHVALLDLVASPQFQTDPQWISQILGITQTAAENSFKTLVRLKYLKEERGQWIKTQKKIRLPTTKSHEAVRNFHKQMIEKALEELEFNISEEAFGRRLISGITITADPMKVDQAKQILAEALHEAAEVLMDGDCTEVYQLNLQVFPLTKSPTKA